MQTPQRWEYVKLEALVDDHNLVHLPKAWNQAGSEGWELVSACYYYAGRIIGIFKRPV